MKNKTFTFIALTAMLTTTIYSQNATKLKGDEPHQKTLIIDNLSSAETAINAFEKLYQLKKGFTYKAGKLTTDNAGGSHQRYQQYYNGIKVEYGTLIVHAKDGNVVSVNGELYNPESLNLQPTVSEQEGLTIAMNVTPAQKYLWDNVEQSKAMDYKKPQAEVIAFPDVITGSVALAYKYDIYALEPEYREEIYVDAHSGSVLFRNSIINYCHRETVSKKVATVVMQSKSPLVIGNADTKYSGSREIETTFDAATSKYVLKDLSRGNGIVTYNSAKTNTRPSTNFTDADNNWTTAEFNNANRDDAALDAHWGAEKTFDFWKNVFNRNSYDDKNAQIKSYVHFDSSPGDGIGWSNANWNGSVMSYGDGPGTTPWTGLDVCGHEIGHAVCTNTANLVYAHQSGAMNEGFSDIWGACIEQYGRTGNLNASNSPNDPVWRIGEDFRELRSMSNPNLYNNANTYKGTYYKTTADDGTCVSSSTNDQCGVHSNSGILNHWFYILTAGKAGTNNAPAAEVDTYDVTGIGMAKSSQIAYFAERDYLTPNATFLDARNATIAVANSLYCENTPEVIAVTNAWNAVNVGDKYVSYPDDIYLKSVTKNSNVACGVSFVPSIVIENRGSNTITTATISYNIDGGTNIVDNWTGSLAPCSSTVYELTMGNLTAGTHKLNVTVTIINDGNANNNTKTVTVVANDTATVNVINTFENATDELVTIDASGLNTVWQRGALTKTVLTSGVAGNSNVYATKLSGQYPDKTTAYLVSKCYDFTSVLNPVLKFDMAFDLEKDYDVLYVEYSKNNGTTWNTLGKATDANWYTSNTPFDNSTNTGCVTCIGGQWTGEGNLTHPSGGTNATKRPYSYNLASFGQGSPAPEASMLFRFVFKSDDASTADGAIIDNFVIESSPVLETPKNEFVNFSVSPNPSNGLVNIALSTPDKVVINLTDLRGRKVYQEVFSNNQPNFSQTLHFGDLSSGLYILNVESQGKKATKKLLIN
jgi:bacillolysin